MGDMPSKIFNRVFDYPLKKRPFSIYTQDDIPTDSEAVERIETKYDIINGEFNRRLLEKRMEIYGSREENTMRKRFPSWDETTVSYLHSLFVMFCDEDEKMLNYTSFVCILECLGDESHPDTRKNRFDATDRDNDGLINYFDFLHAIYNFHPPDAVAGLKRLSTKVAEKAALVNSLSVEKQLEYGLF